MFQSFCTYLLGLLSPRPSARQRLLLATCALIALGPTFRAQTYFPAATKRADLQVGGGYIIARSDYSDERFGGITGYATLDVSPHWGVEFDIHQVNTTGNNHVYQRTYELGGRYVGHYGRFNPYLRASYGRGVFNYPFDRANLAYNIFAGAAGVDVRIKRHLSARAEYEAQYWMKFPGRSLQPDVFTLGAAYHF